MSGTETMTDWDIDEISREIVLSVGGPSLAYHTRKRREKDVSLHLSDAWSMGYHAGRAEIGNEMRNLPEPDQRIQCLTCCRWPKVRNWPNHMQSQNGPHWPTLMVVT